MKKSKNSPKKLPPDKVGLYSFLDPRRVVEEILINWYENMVLLCEAVPPSNLLWSNYFTDEEKFQFDEKIKEVWDDFDKQAYFGFRELISYYGEVSQRQDYLKKIIHRIGCYKSLLSIKSAMKEIIFRKDRREIFGEICITPGQPERTFLHVLIQDLESVSDEYYTKGKNKTYRSVLAFYLAKQDFFEDLKKCVYRSELEKCSMVDCIALRKEKCMRTIKDYCDKQPDLNIDLSKLILCKKRLTYSDCKRCKNNFGYEWEMDGDITEEEIRGIKNHVSLFLRIPCKPAVKRYNDILEGIKQTKRKEMSVGNWHKFQQELNIARLSHNRKKISDIYNRAQELYPHLTRKKIERTLNRRKSQDKFFKKVL